MWFKNISYYGLLVVGIPVIVFFLIVVFLSCLNKSKRQGVTDDLVKLINAFKSNNKESQN